MTDPAYAAQVAFTIAVGITVLAGCLAVVAVTAWCLYLVGEVAYLEVRRRSTGRRLRRQAVAAGRQPERAQREPFDPERHAPLRDPLDGSEPIHRG